MTENEIIKALECCAKKGVPDCDKCSYNECCCDGTNRMLNDTIDLIKRQQAEIERLQGYNENLQTANVALSNEILDIKTEAIKEFAERLKSRTRQMTEYDEGGWDCTRYAIDDEGIDNLANEMTEE
jgi:hypothetical protein